MNPAILIAIVAASLVLAALVYIRNSQDQPLREGFLRPKVSVVADPSHFHDSIIKANLGNNCAKRNMYKTPAVKLIPGRKHSVRVHKGLRSYFDIPKSQVYLYCYGTKRWYPMTVQAVDGSILVEAKGARQVFDPKTNDVVFALFEKCI